MLNSNTGIQKKTLTNVTQILADVDGQKSVGCIVSDNGVTAVGGKKIVKAGTPIAGDMTNRNTAMSALLTSTLTNLTGVLLHDVDVTAGPNNGTLLYTGTVNINRLEDSVKTLWTNDLIVALRPLGVKAIKAN